MISRFGARLDQGLLLLDAAMGTRLIAAGLDLATDDPCLWNLARPDVVLDLHRCNVAAGAEAMFTNTFGANRAWLGRFGRQGAVREINHRAVALARVAAGPDRFVVGSVGPTAGNDRATFEEQVEALLDAGVDALALETCRLDQALATLAHRPVGPETPILVGLYVWPEPFHATADRLIDAGATILGLNCSADLDLIHRLIDAFAADRDRHFWLKPAATSPGGGSLTPTDFAGIARRLTRLNTGALGGCCGTSDVHLRAIRDEWSR